MKHPPGPRGREVFGFFGRGSVGGTLEFLARAARTHGSISSFRLLHKRFYLVDDAELIRELLVTRQHEFVRDSGATLLRELVGDGLITREEPLHKERRRVLQPAFHKDQVAAWADIMAAEAGRLAEQWTARNEFDIRMEMRRLTLGIVGATLFGANFSGSAKQIAAVLQRVAEKSRWLGPAFTLVEPLVLGYRKVAPRGPSLFFRPERAELDRVVTPIIVERRKTGTRDILSLILSEGADSGAPLSQEDVRNELVTFVLAGHETTSAALTWTWYLLAEHPGAEQRLHAEVDRVLGGTELPRLGDLPRLSYTANVFREAMRLFPPAALFARRPKQRTELAGYRIERGESIFLSPYITHRNPRYFERPEEFVPERWEQAAAAIPKFAYFPFGGGAKMCIGESFAQLEGVLALATLASRYRLVREEATKPRFGDAFVLTSREPITMKAVARIQQAQLASRVS